MRIRWALLWAKGGKNKLFRSSGAGDLFDDYTRRINRYSACEVTGKVEPKVPSRALWLCDRAGKTLSSEALSEMIRKLQNASIRELVIVIGPPDGVPADDPLRKEADLLWGFGPMTLPHELAAVVASEQIYRAFTILAGEPYHAGH